MSRSHHWMDRKLRRHEALLLRLVYAKTQNQSWRSHWLLLLIKLNKLLPGCYGSA
ncbi:MAG: hypothetical protein Q8P45_02715 [Candidatus Harrisonbacteria bacterium]|nr:hypothetical protein [Candidatus Harrisonbacteria bacterium]